MAFLEEGLFTSGREKLLKVRNSFFFGKVNYSMKKKAMMTWKGKRALAAAYAAMPDPVRPWHFH